MHCVFRAEMFRFLFVTLILKGQPYIKLNVLTVYNEKVKIVRCINYWKQEIQTLLPLSLASVLIGSLDRSPFRGSTEIIWHRKHTPQHWRKVKKVSLFN